MAESAVCAFKPYRDPERSSGSQSETPSYTVAADATIRVRGYQQYDLKNHQITGVHAYGGKFQRILRALMSIRERTHARTFMDVGCNAGLTSFLAQEAGYAEVYSLDHDTEYIAMLKEVAERDDPNTAIRPRAFSFGEAFPAKADVVFVGALIHWVFTCTANFGRFDSILEYLATATDRVLVIEWIDPEDVAIKSFHHLDCGSIPQEPYDVSGFERALRRVGTITDRWAIPGRSTRVVYTVDLA